MRPAKTDMMQGFRYHVTSANASGVDLFQSTPASDRDNYEAKAVAGFNQVTMPELSVEVAEYREGNSIWAMKFPGPPTVSELSLMRGITKRDTAFHQMVMASVNGQEYRCDVTIWHYQRTEMADAVAGTTDKSKHRRIECGECFATTAKVGDFDATASEVSIAETTIAIEKFDIFPGQAA